MQSNEITSIRGKMIKKLSNEFNLLYINEKEDTYCRAYDSCKSNFYLSLLNLIIAPENLWNSEKVIISLLSWDDVTSLIAETPTKDIWEKLKNINGN